MSQSWYGIVLKQKSQVLSSLKLAELLAFNVEISHSLNMIDILNKLGVFQNYFYVLLWKKIPLKNITKDTVKYR